MENLGKTLTRLFVDMEWRFFSKQRRDRKAFRLITSSVRQFDINIHFLKASVPWLVCQVMNMVKTSRQGFLFGTIIYHHFCIWRKFGRFALQFGVLDTHAQRNAFFEKRVADDKWRSHTLSKRNENWNANRSAFPQKTSLSFQNISACFQNFLLHAIKI